MWPLAFAPTELTDADEAKIGALVKKAVSRAPRLRVMAKWQFEQAVSH